MKCTLLFHGDLKLQADQIEALMPLALHAGALRQHRCLVSIGRCLFIVSGCNNQIV